jgi:cytochrome d ubiquinol oxidase subunit II
VVTDFVSEWLAVFPLAVGVLVLALFVYLAAVYLAVEASDAALRGDFCRRAIGANLALGVVAALAALAAREGAPHLWRELSGSPRALLMQSLIAALAIATIVALRQRRVRLARVLALAQVSLVVLGWVASQGGDLLVGQRTFAQAAAPDSILWPVAYALAAGSVVLVPAFLVLYMLFKLRPRAS